MASVEPSSPSLGSGASTPKTTGTELEFEERQLQMQSTNLKLATPLKNAMTGDERADALSTAFGK